MCGIFGFLSTEGRGPDVAALQTIAAQTETRGRHAFGLAWIDERGKMHTFKRPGAATAHLEELHCCRRAVAVIGHCRWATHGDPQDNRNNHPHPAGRGWLVHNGVVRNYELLVRRYRLPLKTQCDSEVLGLLMIRSPGSLLKRVAWVVNQVEGPLALLGLWRNPVRLLVVRRGNPLCVAQTRAGVYFASLPQGLPGRVLEVADDRASLLAFPGGIVGHKELLVLS
jgi:glucosamine 6-phosphate synthetase-like amidotransferase/phosphosugar isomerase protein